MVGTAEEAVLLMLSEAADIPPAVEDEAVDDSRSGGKLAFSESVSVAVGASIDGTVGLPVSAALEDNAAKELAFMIAPMVAVGVAVDLGDRTIRVGTAVAAPQRAAVMRKSVHWGRDILLRKLRLCACSSTIVTDRCYEGGLSIYTAVAIGHVWIIPLPGTIPLPTPTIAPSHQFLLLHRVIPVLSNANSHSHTHRTIKTEFYIPHTPITNN